MGGKQNNASKRYPHLNSKNCECVDYTARIKTADGINIANHLTLHLEN